MKKKLAILGIICMSLSTFVGCKSAETVNSAEPDRLSEDAVKSIVLADAKLSEDEVSMISIYYDSDEVEPEYEIEFNYNGQEYDYVVHARTGDILSKETSKGEYDPESTADSAVDTSSNNTVEKPTDNTTSKPSNNKANNSTAKEPTVQNNSSDIGLEKAKQIALKKVPGATASNIVKAKKDYDDGMVEYEIDIVYNDMEYEFEIRGTDGQIISQDQESIYD